MKLYGYWRSSASWRVRIGLNLKGMGYDYLGVHLINNGGEQRAPEHTARNPMQQVPVLELDDGRFLTQSMAILTWAEAVNPAQPLFPADPFERARAVEIAEIVNAGIQPLQNLSVLQKLESLGVDKKAWGAQAIAKGLAAIEAIAGDGPFLVGEAPSIADVFAVPQIYNARRFDVDMSAFPRLSAMDARAEGFPGFAEAHPDKQSDAPGENHA